MALVAATTSMAPAPEVDDFATLCEVETAVVAKMQGDERGGFDLCEQLSHGWAWAQSLVVAGGARGRRDEYFSEPFGSQGLGLAVRGFARWPAFVTAEARRLGAAGAPQSAGLLPEIGCAARGRRGRRALVVWDYRRGDDFAVYEGLRDAVSAWLLHPMRFLGVDGAGKDGLVDVVADDAPGALYALSRARGVLGVYDLGRRGRDLRHVGSARVADAAKLWSAAHSRAHDGAVAAALRAALAPGDAKIVAVHVVSPLESATVHCVCVDDAGFRFYFSTTALKSGLGARADAGRRRWALPPPTADGADDALRPRALTLVHVSAPPSTDARELYGAKVGASFYGNGVFVVAKASGRDADRVLECAPSTRATRARRAAKPAEPAPPGGLLLRAGSAPTPSPARAPSPVSAGGDGPKYALREAVSELVDGRGDDGSPASRLVPKVWAAPARPATAAASPRS
ncbi:nucleoporin-like protein [Aureococcus anophagefferens]|uniref:Nucleoporin-like protein n=1 Tax=Aureococcus anophagefferens TaxID=44056 RepID=A0ABR1GB31_AURAN